MVHEKIIPYGCKKDMMRVSKWWQDFDYCPYKVSYLSLFLSILACRPQYDEEISVEMTGYNVKSFSMVAYG